MKRTDPMKKKILVILVLLAIILFFQRSGFCAETPTGRVRAILEAVMAVQSQPELQGAESREKRKTAIKDIISENFDLERMAKETLDSYWEGLSGSQHSEFETIFSDLFQDSYTRLVLDFLRREKILYLKEDTRGEGSLVETLILRTNEEIPVGYLLAPEKEGWLVCDVTIDGVSIIENYRKSFARVIQRESYDALLERMRLQQRAIKNDH